MIPPCAPAWSRQQAAGCLSNYPRALDAPSPQCQVDEASDLQPLQIQAIWRTRKGDDGPPEDTAPNAVRIRRPAAASTRCCSSIAIRSINWARAETRSAGQRCRGWGSGTKCWSTPPARGRQRPAGLALTMACRPARRAHALQLLQHVDGQFGDSALAAGRRQRQLPPGRATAVRSLPGQSVGRTRFCEADTAPTDRSEIRRQMLVGAGGAWQVDQLLRLDQH